MILSSSLENAVVLCDRVLASLWYLSARMGISLGIVWFKDVFNVCTSPFMTSHSLTKNHFFFLYITFRGWLN